MVGKWLCVPSAGQVPRTWFFGQRLKVDGLLELRRGPLWNDSESNNVSNVCVRAVLIRHCFVFDVGRLTGARARIWEGAPSRAASLFA